jgi:tetratricopeptide (TPR) repeat protein
LYGFVRGRRGLIAARKLVREAPSAGAFFRLALREREAGDGARATAAARRALGLAERVGDLDRAANVRRFLAGGTLALPDSYRSELGRACSAHLATKDAHATYAAIRRIRAKVQRRGGHATAVECLLALLTVASLAQDVQGGLRFAHELARMEVSSFASLALALAYERLDRADAAREAFSAALRLARGEGDLHRATKATAGLLRTRGERLATGAELRWAMPEAAKEPASLPDYTYLRATLGLVGAGR